MAVGYIFRDFSQWTSAHGIPHIGSAQNSCLRLFWSLIFIVSMGMFAWQMGLLLDKYLSYDVTVQTELKFEERVFPTVTICNLNPYILENARKNSDLASLLDEYDRAIKGNLRPDDTRFAGLTDTIAIQSKARTYLMYTVAGMSRANQRDLFYKKSDFIVNCAYNIKPCDLDLDFDEEIDPTYGVCYKFNNKGYYNSTRAGPLYGLRILLKSNQSQYISLTESAGVRVSIHGQDEPPFPDAFGYNAATGFTTSYGIQYIATQRLPYPYGNCTGTIPKDIPYFYNNATQYSTEACFRSCMQDMIIRSCNCADPRFSKLSTMKYCQPKPQDINCVTNLTGSQSGQGVDIQSCACQQPCNESTYSVTVSTALWPSEVYKPPDCKDPSSQFNNDPDECQKWYGQNTLLLEVYYERMNYQLLKEQEAYLLVNLISDMGGQLGLWMGFSVITMIEFVALIVLLFMYCCCKTHRSPPEDEKNAFDVPPSYNYTTTDVTAIKPVEPAYLTPTDLSHRKNY